MKVVIVGTSASGKTTLARALAQECSLHHIELDELHWGPNWTEVSDELMLERLDEKLNNFSEWVIDGNYSVTHSRTWPQATHIIWLNLGLGRTFYQAVKRTFSRIFSGTELWHGNKERFLFLFHKDAIPWWVLRTWRKRRMEMPELIRETVKKSQTVIEIRSQKNIPEVLEHLKQELRHHMQK